MLVLLLRSLKWRRREMWGTNGYWIPVINLWAGLNLEPSLINDHKEVLDQLMCVIIVDFKGILDQIAKSWERRIVQLLKGHEDLEMIEEIGQENHREIKNGDPRMINVMKMIGAFTNYLESFSWRFGSPSSRTQSFKKITPNASDVWVKKGTHA